MATTHGSSDHDKADHDKSATHGGKSASHEKSAEGHKGVTQEQVGSGKEHDPNNFTNDRERASAAGQKSGKHSHDRD